MLCEADRQLADGDATGTGGAQGGGGGGGADASPPPPKPPPPPSAASPAPRIGVLELQGDFAEHEAMLARCGAQPVGVRRLEHLLDEASGAPRVDALVIPGGESTTMGKLLVAFGMLEPLRKLVSARDFPVFGTCAGCILLAREIRGRPEQVRIGALDVEVTRNAYGAQICSFECDVESEAFRQAGGGPLRAMHIRAPLIERVLSDRVRVLAESRGKPVIVQQGMLLASTFHPELTSDARVHQHFLRMVRGERP